jgi:hypothetical protein
MYLPEELPLAVPAISFRQLETALFHAEETLGVHATLIRRRMEDTMQERGLSADNPIPAGISRDVRALFWINVLDLEELMNTPPNTAAIHLHREEDDEIPSETPSHAEAA